MLYSLAVILLVAWLLGLVSANTLGGFIHVLLIAALIMILVQFVRERKHRKV